MATLSIQPSYPIFTDTDGSPLENGYIWIGTANLDPQTNPISVYWDAALTVPAVQPIRTLGGYPANSGTPARLYVNSDYSIRVMDKNGSVIYSAPVATERYGNISTLSDLSFIQSGTGAVTKTALSKLREWASPEDFGAIGDGINDDAPAIQLAFNSHKYIRFGSGKSYLMNSGVTVQANDIKIDFGNATIINGGVSFLFTFGSLADTPQNTNLTINGGHFIQLNPATASNYNYILIQAVKDFTVKGCIMDNISNGGLCVYAGAEAGVIDGVKINGRTNYATCRGIWIQGSTASDFSSQYVDTNSITRNATPFATFAAKDIKIVNCAVIVPSYGIYLMNAWDCVIDNCYIDASGVGSNRCIALNNYSPRSRVTNCTLISDRSCTGILVTQCSDDVVISNNVFRGSFGGNRAIYVSYLAQALISNNRFTDTTTQHIQVDMGAFAHVKNNEFVRSAKTNDHRAVYLTAIDTAGTAVGSTGTVLSNSGVVFENNLMRNVGIGVHAGLTIAANNGNQPAPEIIQVIGNTLMNMVSLTASEYPLFIGAGSSGNVVNARIERNVVYPYTSSGRNQPLIAGTDYILEATTVSLASFRVDVVAGGGAVTSTRIAGNNFSLTVSRSGADLALTPRTQLGVAGASIPIVVGATDAGGATLPRTYVVRPSGGNYLVSAYDAAGVQISFATAGISFNVLLGPIALGT